MERVNGKILELTALDQYSVLIYPKQEMFDLNEIENVYGNDEDKSPCIFTTNTLIKAREYQKYWYVENKAILIHIRSNIYFLITNNVIRFSYEHPITDMIFKDGILSIFSKRGMISIINDHKNYLAVEIDSYFKERNEGDKISEIMKTHKYRYIPCLCLEDYY